MIDRPLDQLASLLPLEVCGELGTTPQGLTEEEARRRLQQHGPNTIGDGLEPSAARRVLASFANWITLILLVAGLLAFFSDTPLIGWVILIVALINGLFTTWQEYLAEREIAALRHLLPATTYVRRAGQVRQIPTAEIVPGDILPLKPGTIVAADGYLITSEGLRVKQTALTGNAAPITKVAGPMPDTTLTLAERPNLLLAGTVAFEGQGSLLAVGTGMETLLGRIAESTAALRAEQSPLGRALSTLAATLTRVAVIAGVVAFLLAAFGQQLGVQAGIIFAIGMIVAFVPEGLLPTVTLALALARRRLARYGVLVRRLAGVESLSSATVLCLDRTDALTSGALAVRQLWAGDRLYSVTGTDYRPEGSFLSDRALVQVEREPDLLALLRGAAIGNNARLLPPNAEHDDWHILGDPAEGALLVAAERGGLDTAAIGAEITRIQSFPYEPRRQIASIVAHVPRGGDRVTVAVVRGAAQSLLPLCTRLLRDGAPQPIDGALRQQLQETIDSFARAGQRVVALAERPIEDDGDGLGYRARDVERDLTLLGLCALQEPPAPEITRLIEGCRRAGIRVIVVSGSYGLTAEASARRAGIILASRAHIVTGADLDALSTGSLGLVIAPGEEVIFAQLDAAQKRRVVEALQQRGEVVTFLGDSINDAPALKQADIGVAVSSSGTAVAVAAADIVLNADHPAGLLLAVEEGRAIFGNIQKFAAYIFTHNVAETVVIVASVLLGVPLPLTVQQVLAIDLGTELLPSVALSTEPPEPGQIDQPPRSRTQPLLDRPTLVRVFAFSGLIEGALALLAFFLAYWTAGWRPGLPIDSFAGTYTQATTLTYAAIVLAQAGNAFTSRTRRVSLLQIGPFTNRALLAGVALSLLLMLLLIYVEPLAQIFGFVPPTLTQWAVLATFPLIMVLAGEAYKAWENRREAATAAAHAGDRLVG